MNITEKNEGRIKLNSQLAEADDFFKIFGQLDDKVYTDAAIPKKYKELTGLSISVLSRCNECILYHMQECIKQKANKSEIIDAIKIGVIGGGSITFPNARYAMEIIHELNIQQLAFFISVKTITQTETIALVEIYMQLQESKYIKLPLIPDAEQNMI